MACAHARGCRHTGHRPAPGQRLCLRQLSMCPWACAEAGGRSWRVGGALAQPTSRWHRCSPFLLYRLPGWAGVREPMGCHPECRWPSRLSAGGRRACVSVAIACTGPQDLGNIDDYLPRGGGTNRFPHQSSPRRQRLGVSAAQTCGVPGARTASCNRSSEPQGLQDPCSWTLL